LSNGESDSLTTRLQTKYGEEASSTSFIYRLNVNSTTHAGEKADGEYSYSSVPAETSRSTTEARKPIYSWVNGELRDDVIVHQHSSRWFHDDYQSTVCLRKE
jgi:hypothetical protein